ncbi:MAG: hypothetical protein ABSC51_02310 [Gaiellaceae bacterium]|jgi:hypothetical protein
MTAIRKRPSLQQTLRFLAAGAVLTGFWLVPLTAVWAFNHEAARYALYALLALVMFLGGIYVWSQLAERPRQAFAHVLQALFWNLMVLFPTWLFVGLVSMSHRLCRPGELNGPAHIAWLAPLFAYTAVGSLGFARQRRLRLIWPLALVAAYAVLLAIELIWTTNGGCGD